MIHRNRIAAALLATAFAFALVACGGSGKSAQTAPAPTATGTNPTPTSPVPTPTGPQTSKSSLTVQTTGGTSPFYPLLDKSLVNYVPGQVEGTVRIISVVGPTGFWAGRNKSQRFLVELRLKGTRAPKLRPGRRAHIIGQLQANPPDAGKRFGVTGTAGKALLGRQGAYLSVSIGDLKFS